MTRFGGGPAINRVQVFPLTTTVDNLYPCEAYVTLGDYKSKAMAGQLATASKKRLRDRIGFFLPQDMDGIARIIRLQLDLG